MSEKKMILCLFANKRKVFSLFVSLFVRYFASLILCLYFSFERACRNFAVFLVVLMMMAGCG